MTEATVGTTATEAVAFAIGAIDGLLEEADFEVAGVDMKVPLEDFEACSVLSEELAANDIAVGDWRRDDEVDSWMGDTVAPLSSLIRAIEPLEVGVVAF